LLYTYPYRFGAPLFPKSSGRAALNAANDPAQMSGDCDHQDRGKCKQDIDDARRLLRNFPMANTPPAQKPDHSARCQCEDQMKEQVSFKFRTFQLPLPCGQSAGNGYRRSERRRHKIIVCGLRHRWIPSPDREEIKRHTANEQRDRKMNDHRVLRVFCQQGCFEVKWVHVVDGYLTMICAVIRGWMEQK